MRSMILLTASAVLAGCSMQPGPVAPGSTIPASWPTGDAYLRQNEAGLPEQPWRTVFGDARLQALIAQALEANQDVQAAAARVALARAQYRIQRAEQLPQLDAGATLSRNDAGGSARADVGITGYEIDLFGRLDALGDAAKARYLASDSAARAVRLSLVADVADAWLAYGADSSLLAVARQTVEAAEQSRKLTEVRYKGGIAPRSDVRQAEIALHTAEADVALQTTRVAQDLNTLRLLVGGEVAADRLPHSIEDAVGQIVEVAPGLDSQILLRRPDVMEAEWQLSAANAQIGAARAALFPRISLTGLMGLASTGLSGLFSGGSFNWQGGGAVSYSIFSGGAAKANVRASEAQRDLALAQYRKAIQSAFADVSDVLAQRGTIDAQLAAVHANLVAAEDNLKLSDMRYKGGVESYLQNLSARLASYNAARALVQTRLVAASNRVALYRALGGDASF